MPKLGNRLTEMQIRNAKPKDKPYKLTDQEGLRLLVRPSGKKVWQLQYSYNKKQNTFTIGNYSQVSTAEARQKRDVIRSLVKQGIDPNQKKQDDIKQRIIETEHSFENVAREWYSKQTWAEKHAKNINSRLEKDVFKYIGKKPITDITVRDILDILKRIEERGALDVAKRIGQYCTAIFDFAIINELREDNPALGRSRMVKSFKRQNRPHLLENELPAFMARLNSFDGKDTVRIIVHLLALTFVRPGELRAARWEEIDFDNAMWSVPAHRMKMSRDHLVPLSKQSLYLLHQLHKMTSNTEFLFPGRDVRKPISDVGVIKAVRKLTDDKATPHGFRHTASTILNEKGFNGDHVEAQLAHVEESKVRGVYNKAQYLEARREMMQWWADYLDEPTK